MTYHKSNLKEKLKSIAFEICEVSGWGDVNMRKLAEKAGVSHTALYRHFRDKNALLIEIIIDGFKLLNEDLEASKVSGGFTAMGKSYIEFGLNHKNIYDLMFGTLSKIQKENVELKKVSDHAFSYISNAVRLRLSKSPENQILIQSYHIWASIHGLVSILRSAENTQTCPPTLNWIKENLEEYLDQTIFYSKV